MKVVYLIQENHRGGAWFNEMIFITKKEAVKYLRFIGCKYNKRLGHYYSFKKETKEKTYDYSDFVYEITELYLFADCKEATSKALGLEE